MLSKPLLKLRSALVCTLALAAVAAHAQTTINVGPGQTYTTIQSGINAAVNGDTVLVAPGTYYEQLNFNGKGITLTSSGGASNTIIDGSGTGTVVFMSSTSATQLAILDGFTIQHGYPNGTGNAYNYGGAVDADGNAIVRNNTITSNSSCGVDVLDSNVTVQNNHILNNVGANTAGADCRVNAYGILVHGLSINNASVNLENNLIERNENGGISVYDLFAVATINITKNTISNNGLNQSLSGIGSGISFGDYAVYNIVGNLITGSGGPGIYEFLSQVVTFVNNTVYFNSLMYTPQYTFQGTEVQMQDAAGVLSNNIIVGNRTPYPVISCMTVTGGTPASWDHNIIYDTATGTGSIPCFSDPTGINLYVNPKLNNPAGSDYHLATGSPAIDAGNDNDPLITATDLDGNPRVQNATGKGCIVDIGVYEYAGTVSGCTTTETLQSSLNPSTYGLSVTFTAQLSSSSGVPTGDVQFADGATVLGAETISSTGVSTYTTSSLAVGSHALTATYQPTGSFPATSASLTQTVNAIPTAATLTFTPVNPTVGARVTLLATITPYTAQGYTATGTVTFTNNGVTIGTATLTNGAAQYVIPAISAGKNPFSCTYSGDTNFAPSVCGTVPVTVNGLPTTASLTASVDPVNTGTAVTFTAVIAPVPPATTTPTGTVNFYNGTTLLNTTPVPLSPSGFATFTISTLSPGKDKITCTYSGDATYAPSTCNTVTETVIDTITTITITSNKNPSYTYQNVIFILKTTSKGKVPLSPITLTANGTLLATLTPTTETTRYKTAFDLPGTYSIVASFAGNSTQSPSSATLSQVVTLRPSSVALTVTPAKALVGTPVTLSAATLGINANHHPGGDITFYDGTTALATLHVKAGMGTGSFTTSALAPGPHSLTCTYTGNKHYAGNNCNVVSYIVYAPATVALTATPSVVFLGNPVALGASVSSTYATPTGTLTFLDGTTPLGTVALASGATGTSSAGLTTTTLALGTHSITASYSGDTNFAAAVSPPVTVIVEDFALTIANSPLTIHHGGTAVFNLSLNAVGGPMLASPITLTVSGNPDHAPVTFSPATVPATGIRATATLTIATPDYPVGPWSSLHKPTYFRARNTSLAMLALGSMLLPFTRRSRRRLQRLTAVLIFAAASILLGSASGCGSGWGDQSYHITVTAASGNLSHTATAILITEP
jgi:hypothetical protein